ncbi:histidine kinase dimerization/phosphoacceptor domain -containing protein [Maribacter sp.]|uniref:histidine kinase dimerization/phosphoacceptor domain -containing protein n=1 Tax=Maribacter sp. TaxID=1897614 RepID=UPI003C79482E
MLRSGLRIAFFFIFTPLALWSQDVRLDSIDKLLSKDLPTVQLTELLLLAAETSLIQDSTVYKTKSYTSELRTLLGVNSDSALLIRALKLDAHADRISGNYIRSIEQFEICHDYFSRTGDTLNLAFTANQLGSMNVFMGQNEKAQRYLFEVYNVYKAQGNKQKLAQATNGLAIYYNNTNQEDKAIERYIEALKMFRELKDTMGQANVHANLGITYTDRGEFTKAEYHIGMQGKLDSLLNTQWGLGFFFDYLGYLREKQGRYQEAYQNHLQSLKIRENLSSHYNITESRISLAAVLIRLGNYDEAIAEANKVFENYEERQSLHQLQSSYQLLSEAFEAKKEIVPALKYHKLYKKISDSIFNTDLIETITEKDAKFEKVQKESEIAMLNLKNESSQKVIGQKDRTILIGGTGFFFVSLLCVGLYFITRKYLKQKQQLAQALSDKDILLREIHHRVKNNLQLVSSLLTLQGRSIDSKSAQKAINEGRSRIRSMALIHQDLYQRENITSVNTQQYFKNLCQELFTTYCVSEDKVALEMAIEDISVDVDTLVPLGLITNEIISNSLKYAFPKHKNGTLKVVLKGHNGGLYLMVRDNGIGYDPNDIPANSFGTRLIHSLSQQLEAELIISTKNGTTIEVIMDTLNTDKNE